MLHTRKISTLFQARKEALRVGSYLNSTTVSTTMCDDLMSDDSDE